VTLPGFETLTTPTIITTQYIESKTKTTTGPIYVGTGWYRAPVMTSAYG
jgi:hypothetical protein